MRHVRFTYDKTMCGGFGLKIKFLSTYTGILYYQTTQDSFKKKRILLSNKGTYTKKKLIGYSAAKADIFLKDDATVKYASGPIRRGA